MQTHYRINREELNEDFLQTVKARFKGKIIDITISDDEGMPSANNQPRSLREWIGALKDSPSFAGDPQAIQRELRDEWDHTS